MPGAGGAYLARARALQKCGRFDAALADYDKCVSLQPGDAAAWALRGVMLHDNERCADAAETRDRDTRQIVQQVGHRLGAARRAIDGDH